MQWEPISCLILYYLYNLQILLLFLILFILFTYTYTIYISCYILYTIYIIYTMYIIMCTRTVIGAAQLPYLILFTSHTIYYIHHHSDWSHD